MFQYHSGHVNKLSAMWWKQACYGGTDWRLSEPVAGLSQNSWYLKANMKWGRGRERGNCIMEGRGHLIPGHCIYERRHDNWNGNRGLSRGVASKPKVTGHFLLEEAETFLGKPLKKGSNAKGWGWGAGIQFLTIAGASPSTPKIKEEEEEEMGLIKKVQLEESCAHDHKPE